jgi:hypothetical protein
MNSSTENRGLYSPTLDPVNHSFPKLQFNKLPSTRIILLKLIVVKMVKKFPAFVLLHCFGRGYGPVVTQTTE